MKKFKKMMVSVLAGVVALTFLPGFSSEDVIEGTVVYEAGTDSEDVEDVIAGTLVYEAETEGDDEVTALPQGFLSITGTVTEITPFYDTDGEAVPSAKFIRIEGEDGTTVFRTDFNTFILGAQDIEAGDNIAGYFPHGPMTMIYPPQHLVYLIVNYRHRPEHEEVKIDRFNLNEDGVLVSADGMLQLNFTDQTPILLQDGRDFREDIAEIRRQYEELGIELPTSLELMDALDGRMLVVTYGPTTRGIPAQTIPGEDGQNMKIVVLFERAVALPGGISLDTELPQAELHQTELPQIEDNTLMEWTVNEIVVEGEIIAAQWQRIDGVYYVPLRAVVDALGLGDTIEWNGDTRSVTLSNGTSNITMTIGSNNYLVGGTTIYGLTYAPIIVDNRTYVPFRFFSEIFGMTNAYHLEGQVVINNDELMQ